MASMGDTEEPRLKRLASRFPNLATSHVRLTSPDDHGYNCLAWAADETVRCWHPASFGGMFWPGGPAEDTVEEWIRAYATLGYRVSDSAALESGSEKLAIYADGELPLHVARQLPNGYWTSKLGPREDVEHELDGLVGSEYGRVVAILARPAGPRSGLTACAPGRPLVIARVDGDAAGCRTGQFPALTTVPPRTTPTATSFCATSPLRSKRMAPVTPSTAGCRLPIPSR